MLKLKIPAFVAALAVSAVLGGAAWSAISVDTATKKFEAIKTQAAGMTRSNFKTRAATITTLANEGVAALTEPVAPPAPPPPTDPPAGALLTDTFDGPDGLVANEYTYWNPNDTAAVRSADWEMTSGSLFRAGNTGYTGKLDSCDPDRLSATCTNSNVFRLNTKRTFAGNTRVKLRLYNEGISGSTSWYGVHIWLRYQSQYDLYYASINRADGNIVIKRKVKGGTDNGGTYIELSSYTPHKWAASVWQKWGVTIQTNADGTVTIKMYDDATGALLLTGTDKGGINPYNGAAYAPITAAGAVGVRGDFDKFRIDDFTVEAF